MNYRDRLKVWPRILDEIVFKFGLAGVRLFNSNFLIQEGNLKYNCANY